MTDEIRHHFAKDGALLPVVAHVFTPYHLLFLERLWSLIEDRPLLLVDGRPDRFRDSRPPALPNARILSLPLNGQVNSPVQAAMIRDVIAEVDRFTGGGPFAHITASYQWPAANILFTRHRRDPRARFLLMDDGLSTYISVRPSVRERTRNIPREIVSRLRGFPRRSFVSGHPLGLDIAEIEAIFIGTQRPPSAPAHRNYISLPPSSETIRFTPDAVLFVGQPYAAYYPEEQIYRTIDWIGRDLASRGFRRMGFKPHHFQRRDEIERYLALGFELVDPPVPVEEMLVQSEFRTIASINTSALLTTRSLFGDAIHAIAYAPAAYKPHQESRDMAEVEAIFRLAGVEVMSEPGGR
jgi:hypothetical protein